MKQITITATFLFTLNLCIAQNPFITHMYTADPSARIFNDTLFVYPSHDQDTAKFFDMIDYHVFSTTDMKNWTDHGVALTLDDISWAKEFAWAPDCIEKDGKYYLYFPTDRKHIGVAVSDNPAGPFKDAIGKPLISVDTEGVICNRDFIDPAVLIDDDGQAYLFVGQNTVNVIKLNDDMISYDGEVHIIEGADHFFEASWIHKKEGKYYLSYSGQGEIQYAMSDNVLGPYEFKGTILGKVNSGTNHHSIVDYKGQWYLFYHTSDLYFKNHPEEKPVVNWMGKNPYRRSICVDSLFYNEDGTIKEVNPTKEGVKGINSTPFLMESNFNEDYSKYLPEMKNLNKILSQLPPSPSILTVDGLERSRKNLAAFNDTNTVLKYSGKEINGPSGNVPITIFKPDTINAVVLQIHGGGWYQGSPELGAHLNDEMARACKVAIVSVDYRLAPENPFPACIGDCKAAARWLFENAKDEFGTDMVFVSGESAGAHLAALTTIYIRDSLNSINKVRGVNLIYGIYDLGRTPSHRMATDSSFLSKRSLTDMMELVFGGWSIQQLQQPQYSPMFANLSNLPPALFTVGAIDPFVDDTYFMEARWRMAGNRTYLAVYPESSHGVDGFPTKLAKEARAKMYWWINSLNKKKS